MFKPEEKSTFRYWFAHWCAFQMTALNLRIWKPKYLLHDIWKPWHFLLFYSDRPEDYYMVRNHHRKHNNHHIEWLENHRMEGFDIDAFIIDNECSRYTKEDSPVPAKEWIQNHFKEAKMEWWKQPEEAFDIDLYRRLYVYKKALARCIEIGL